MNLVNLLSDEQVERLAILNEECGEIQQVIGKILRHGYAASCPITERHPLGSDPNFILLEKEIGDFLLIVHHMMKTDISEIAINNHMIDKSKRINKYLHFNKISEWEPPAHLKDFAVG